jgi:hypothetical protein
LNGETNLDEGEERFELNENRDPDRWFKARIVAEILGANPEGALDLLCDFYRVERPKLAVGVVEGRTKGVQAVYLAQKKQILAARREFLYDPFTIIHEFYHHLRYFNDRHRGTEKLADRFAIDFIEAYKAVLKALGDQSSGVEGRERREQAE